MPILTTPITRTSTPILPNIQTPNIQTLILPINTTPIPILNLADLTSPNVLYSMFSMIPVRKRKRSDL